MRATGDIVAATKCPLAFDRRIETRYASTPTLESISFDIRMETSHATGLELPMSQHAENTGKSILTHPSTQPMSLNLLCFCCTPPAEIATKGLRAGLRKAKNQGGSHKVVDTPNKIE